MADRSSGKVQLMLLRIFKYFLKNATTTSEPLFVSVRDNGHPTAGSR